MKIRTACSEESVSRSSVQLKYCCGNHWNLNRFSFPKIPQFSNRDFHIILKKKEERNSMIYVCSTLKKNDNYKLYRIAVILSYWSQWVKTELYLCGKIQLKASWQYNGLYIIIFNSVPLKAVMPVSFVLHEETFVHWKAIECQMISFILETREHSLQLNKRHRYWCTFHSGFG